MFKYENEVIVTLGPEGTDSHNIAKKLSNNIILQSSFEQAMQYAFENKHLCLLCCGFVEIHGETIVNTWDNIHFSYYKKMAIIEAFFCDTKPMALAIKDNLGHKPYTLIIHPSTKPLIGNFKSDIIDNAQIIYVNNKPEAVEKVVSAGYDACLGSLDIISKYSCLRVIKTFFPQMVWALYQRQSGEIIND